MKRRLWRAGLMLIVAVLVTPMPASGAKGPALSDEEEVYKQLELFEHALSIVRSDYVEQPKAE
ncbi:MAG: hypothetical protein HYS71_00655, partial [Candidatus Omnitrophica bacterium]|nr:hypothetical protein [Candidatus Omnitrophota bacterium]